MIGTTLGNFDIHTLPGRGGMGRIYRSSRPFPTLTSLMHQPEEAP